MFTRRQLLKAGLAGGAVLVVARAAYGPFSAGPEVADDPEFAYAFLGAKERTLLSAIVPVMLDGALPSDRAAHDTTVIDVVRGVDVALSGLPPAVQEEVRQLFGLLGFPVTRRLVAGVSAPWLEASRESIGAFLEHWRASRFALLQSAYQALHQLILAAWYGNPASWPRTGYPGPPSLNRESP
jgi:hypothetical protein